MQARDARARLLQSRRGGLGFRERRPGDTPGGNLHARHRRGEDVFFFRRTVPKNVVVVVARPEKGFAQRRLRSRAPRDGVVEARAAVLRRDPVDVAEALRERVERARAVRLPLQALATPLSLRRGVPRRLRRRRRQRRIRRGERGERGAHAGLLGVERARGVGDSRARDARRARERSRRRELETPAAGKDASASCRVVVVVVVVVFFFRKKKRPIRDARAAAAAFATERTRERVGYAAHRPSELSRARVRGGFRAVEQHQRGGEARRGANAGFAGFCFRAGFAVLVFFFARKRDDREAAGRVGARSASWRVRGIVRIPARGGARDARGTREITRLDRARVQDDRAADRPRERAQSRSLDAGTDDGDEGRMPRVFFRVF